MPLCEFFTRLQGGFDFSGVGRERRAGGEGKRRKAGRVEGLGGKGEELELFTLNFIMRCSIGSIFNYLH